MKPTYESPLASRYASKTMLHLFSPDMRYETWRRLWVALARAEHTLGLPITQAQVDELAAHVSPIDYDVVAAREKEVRHDVMAHIYAYGLDAPGAKGVIHLGATSCYVTDNADLILYREALRYLESELPYYRRHPNRSLHFLMMDMDHFKHINDEYGHLEGDAALVLLAGILKKVCANYNGVLARYGGDEFCIACGCNSVEVRTLIASIQRELDAANAASGKPYQIEISIGCARLEPDIATVHDLIDKADQEMYHLKTRKRGIS